MKVEDDVALVAMLVVKGVLMSRTFASAGLMYISYSLSRFSTTNAGTTPAALL